MMLKLHNVKMQSLNHFGVFWLFSGFRGVFWSFFGFGGILVILRFGNILVIFENFRILQSFLL